MENVLVIGIAGGTGSGKTTLMKNLISSFHFIHIMLNLYLINISYFLVSTRK